MGEFVERSLADTMPGLKLPWFSRMLMFPRGWLLGVPLPWVVYASLLSARRELSPAAVFRFAGMLGLFLAVFVGALVIALTLPFIPYIP
ncbi:MAG: hypothetical protein KDM81_05290 [Verrucomicrobiae bacterium]|nr:hypothetical protein [Verrucomicrobiae bacterium]